MLGTYKHATFPTRPLEELAAANARHHPVVVVGAGPVGLTAAVDLALQGVQTVLLNDDDTLSVGSRAICFAKRTLEVLDRLDVGEDCVRKGVSWNVGRTFFGEDEVYHFDLQPQPDYHRPGMINLQQYYVEEYLATRAAALPALDMRFRNKVVGVAPAADGVQLQVETPDGSYSLASDWLVVADGASSSIRHMLGLKSEGKVFKGRFLIADVVMKADFPSERWFWFNPPFHRGQSALLHHQPDNVWRIDLQLGWDVDPVEEAKPENVIPRIKAMLGPEREFELEWVSVYSFQSRRMQDFRHGHVLFVGDAAHQVSVFGARGANSGIQDADNLVWKLKLVMNGKAPQRLLDSYSEERVTAADENIKESTRSTDFMTPSTPVSVAFRNVVLRLAARYPFARALVNSGRLSVPTSLCDSSLNTPDTDHFTGHMTPGTACDDSPMTDPSGDFWLLERLGGRFQLLVYVDEPAALAGGAELQGLTNDPIPVQVILVCPRAGQSAEGFPVLRDRNGRFAQRYDARHGSAWLIRPDQHVAARWRTADAELVRAAVARATCNEA